jgi:hypothetical protein
MHTQELRCILNGMILRPSPVCQRRAYRTHVHHRKDLRSGQRYVQIWYADFGAELADPGTNIRVPPLRILLATLEDRASAASCFGCPRVSETISLFWVVLVGEAQTQFSPQSSRLEALQNAAAGTKYADECSCASF